MARHPRLQALALPPLLLAALRGSAGQSTGCQGVDTLVQSLSPGYWSPSVIFGSLQVTTASYYPPDSLQGSQVLLNGICNAASFRADAFTRSPPSDGKGDWIATTTSTQIMQLQTDSYTCALSGIAVVTSGSPQLRLQFDRCSGNAAGGAAVVVQLVRAPQSGLRLVNWMCSVADSSTLCSQLQSTSGAATPNQPLLDLSQLASLASNGMTRQNATTSCFGSIDWFSVSASLGVDPSEWDLLQKLRDLLRPSGPLPSVQPSLLARTEVVAACAVDCQGGQSPSCGTAAPLGPAAPADFFASFGQREVLPWLLGLLALALLLGVLLGCLCSCCCHREAPEKRSERRIKKVDVTYTEADAQPHTFLSSQRGSGF